MLNNVQDRKQQNALNQSILNHQHESIARFGVSNKGSIVELKLTHLSGKIYEVSMKFMSHWRILNISCIQYPFLIKYLTCNLILVLCCFGVPSLQLLWRWLDCIVMALHIATVTSYLYLDLLLQSSNLVQTLVQKLQNSILAHPHNKISHCFNRQLASGWHINNNGWRSKKYRYSGTMQKHEWIYLF